MEHLNAYDYQLSPTPFSQRPQLDRQRLDAAQRRERSPLDPIDQRLQRRTTLQYCIDGDARLGARQYRAETMVDPLAETEMAVRRTRDIKPVGIPELQRVTIGGT